MQEDALLLDFDQNSCSYTCAVFGCGLQVSYEAISLYLGLSSQTNELPIVKVRFVMNPFCLLSLHCFGRYVVVSTMFGGLSRLVQKYKA